MKLRWSDNKIISVLFVALILQILLLLWHMEIIDLGLSSQTGPQGTIAGKIEIVENSLKRRPLDSLIWEKTDAPDNVYFHDSVLTLSESRAKIHLKNGTQINLSENTLITIEPPQENQSSEIRIQFSQGNIKARNPYKEAIIKDKNVTLNLKANSDIEISKSKAGDMEIVVNQGTANLVHQGETVKLDENQVLSIEKGEIKKDQIDNTLEWTSPSYIRIYTHEPTAMAQFRWKGSAQQIVIRQAQKTVQETNLNENSQHYDVELPLGSYKVQLLASSGLSRSVELEIWKAPKIDLISPLPRNRLKTGEVTFIWRSDRNFKKYILQMNGLQHQLNFDSAINKLQIPVEVEDDFQWSVFAEDEKGFRIPARYTQPIYLRKNPFAPPKLKKPKLLKKNPKTSWLQFLFISSAWAQQMKQALFSWEAIPGANVYYLEISEDKDFKSTLVQEKLRSTEFVWSKIDDQKTYYWRVAAGTESGRMGVFSEATLVELEIPVETKKPEVNKPVAVATQKKPAPVEIPKADPPPAPIENPEKDETEKVHRPLIGRWSVAWQPSWTQWQFSTLGPTKANLAGLNLTAGSVFIDFNLRKKSNLLWISQFQSIEFEPSPKEDFPFQPNLKTRKWVNQWLLRINQSRWLFGLMVADLPNVERANFEEVKVKPTLALGALVRRDFAMGDGTFQSTLGILNFSDQWGAGLQMSWRHPLFWSCFHVGLQLESFGFWGSNRSSFYLDSSAILGLEF